MSSLAPAPEITAAFRARLDGGEGLRAAELAAGGRVFRIPAGNLDTLREAVTKLARRGRKLGLEPATLAERGIEHVPDDTGLTEYTYVVISGQAPVLDGWRLVATLDHAEHGTIVRRAATEGPHADADLTPWRKADALCEHCSTRRRRNDTYVVGHEDGRLIQVGRTCLRDFIGSESAEGWARYCEQFAALLDAADDLERDSEDSGTAAFSGYDVVRFLTLVATQMRVNGWVSRAMDPERSTSERARASYRARRDTDSPNSTDEDAERAAAALAWAREPRDAEKLSEYEHNLRVALADPFISARNLGLAASVIVSYEREIKRRIERERAAAEDKGHVGEPGERLTFQVTITSTRFVPNGRFGSSELFTMLDDAGHVLKWFCSGDNHGMTQGGTYTLAGTVKEHDTWHGQSQTVLTRCKVKD